MQQVRPRDAGEHALPVPINKGRIFQVVDPFFIWQGILEYPI